MSWLAAYLPKQFIWSSEGYLNDAKKMENQQQSSGQRGKTKSTFQVEFDERQKEDVGRWRGERVINTE